MIRLSILIILLFESIKGYTQTDKLKMIIPSDSTALGEPDGKLVNKKIGAQGGTVISEDGMAELIFPEGALTDSIRISIQPCVNLAPNGEGKTYRFEPSGINFNKPVKIILHYTEEESELCPPELLSFATQDDNGAWTFFGYNNLDSVNRTITGEIQHFSYFTKSGSIRLLPLYSRIKLNGEVVLSLTDISSKVKKTDGTIENPFAFMDSRTTILWYANNILFGNAEVGEISSNVVTEKRISKLLIDYETYKAPNSFPAQNPVIITVNINPYSENPRLRKPIKLRAKIEIYDTYKIKVVGTWDNTNTGRFDKTGTSVWMDSSTVDIEISQLGCRVKEINNYPFLLKEYNTGKGGKMEWLNKESTTGPIHIKGIRKSDYHKLGSIIDAPGPDVSLTFDPAVAIGPSLKMTGKNATPITSPAFRMPAQPKVVEFKLNGMDQKYDITDETYQLGKGWVYIYHQ